MGKQIQALKEGKAVYKPIYNHDTGAVLKQYDDDWFGNAVTVVEMDGEIDMSNMDSQLKEIESNFEGLSGKSPTELSEAMVKLKSSPGTENGTGLMQTVIAMKVREVYEKMTGAS